MEFFKFIYKSITITIQASWAVLPWGKRLLICAGQKLHVSVINNPSYKPGLSLSGVKQTSLVHHQRLCFSCQKRMVWKEKGKEAGIDKVTLIFTFIT